MNLLLLNLCSDNVNNKKTLLSEKKKKKIVTFLTEK